MRRSCDCFECVASFATKQRYSLAAPHNTHLTARLSAAREGELSQLCEHHILGYQLPACAQARTYVGRQRVTRKVSGRQTAGWQWGEHLQ